LSADMGFFLGPLGVFKVTKTALIVPSPIEAVIDVAGGNQALPTHLDDLAHRRSVGSQPIIDLGSGLPFHSRNKFPILLLN